MEFRRVLFRSAGVGRFVVGLLDDIRIVDSPELTGYIREYIAANTPKM